MDKRSITEIEVELLNGHLFCVELPEDEMKNGLYVPTSLRDKRYKKVLVLKDEDVSNGDPASQIRNGDVLVVPLHSGTQVEEEGSVYIIINKRDILYIKKDAI